MVLVAFVNLRSLRGLISLCFCLLIAEKVIWGIVVVRVVKLTLVSLY